MANLIRFWKPGKVNVLYREFAICQKINLVNTNWVTAVLEKYLE